VPSGGEASSSSMFATSVESKRTGMTVGGGDCSASSSSSSRLASRFSEGRRKESSRTRTGTRGGDGVVSERDGGSGMLRGERQSSSDQVRVDWGVKSGVSFVIDDLDRQVRGSSDTGRPGEISPEFERSRPLAKA
jgi:hypothetical protein